MARFQNDKPWYTRKITSNTKKETGIVRGVKCVLTTCYQWVWLKLGDQ